MARVSTYLNFPGTTEAAFAFYKTVFGTEYVGSLMRFGDMNNPDLPAEAHNKILHIELPILGGHVIMATDVLTGMGEISQGNGIHINLEPDTRTHTEALFNALAENGEIRTPLAAMFWGGYYGVLTDQFGIGWMFNCASET